MEYNEPFHLENALNLTHEFFYDDFNKNILLNFLIKFVIQKFVLNLMHFQGKWFIFFLKKKALRSESVNFFHDITTTNEMMGGGFVCLFDLTKLSLWVRLKC